MPDTKISALTLNVSPSSTDVFPVVNNGVTKKISLLNAFKAADIPTSSENYIIVSVSNNAITNGTNLLNAYTTARNSTPNFLPLSPSNRVAIILLPGTYNFGTSSLNLNTQYVDIVGLTKDASHVILTSTNTTATISQTANDVRCIGLTVNNTGNSSFSNIRAGWAPSSNLNLTYWENVNFKFINTNILSGTFKNCKISPIIGGGGPEGSVVIASGTFINCTGLNSGDSRGGFAGWRGTVSGKFTNCIGSNTNVLGGGFVGYAGITSGTFINCTGINSGGSGGGFVGYYGTISTGIFINCTGINSGSSGGGFAGGFGIGSGTFINYKGSNSATAGGGFVGADSSITGTFTNCVGFNTHVFGNDFSNNGTISGTFINCSGSLNNNILRGVFINHRSSDITLPPLTSSGNPNRPACYINCLDGSGRLVNGSA